MSTLVVPNFVAIDPQHARIIDGAKVQEHIRFFPVSRNLKVACIPDDFMKGLIIDAGQFTLIREWDSYPQRQRAAVLPTLFEPLILVVKCEFPLAVEVQPSVANELRAWIFGAGNSILTHQLFLTLPRVTHF